MAANMKWHGDEFKAKVEAHLMANLAAACIVLANYAKKLISAEGTGRTIKAHTAKYGWGEKKSYRKKQLIYNFAPSSPGEPPRKQMGRLLGSVAWEIIGSGLTLVGRVGTNVIYGRWLELGTKRMKARPWLRRSLLEMQATIAKIICRPMK